MFKFFLQEESVERALDVVELCFKVISVHIPDNHSYLYNTDRKLEKECLVGALKAFESTMKAICKIRRWPSQPNDTAKTLIGTCLAQGLLPPYLESQFGSLRSLLENGVPTVRNKLGGHGQGADPTVVPEYLARYTLNLTATSILLLVEAHVVNK